MFLDIEPMGPPAIRPKLRPICCGPGKAIELFEKPNVGALTLVTAKHEAVDDKFTEETYKTALRAYISALASATDSTAADELIKKTEWAMAGLKSVVPADEAGQRRLVAIYYSLARDLETQMELADPKLASNLAKGFETLLNQVRSTSSDAGVAPTMGGAPRGRRLCRLMACRRSTSDRLNLGRWTGGRFFRH